MKKNTKPKKKMKRRTLFTLLSMFNLTWYTIIVLFASFSDHTVQSELTIAWFAAWTTELALLYGIKVHEKYTNESDPCECSEENEESNPCDNDCKENNDTISKQSDSFDELCDIDD